VQGQQAQVEKHHKKAQQQVHLQQRQGQHWKGQSVQQTSFHDGQAGQNPAGHAC
jgi:hypothetical protein